MKLKSSFKRALAYTLSVALVLTSISFDDSYLLKAKAETATGSQSQSAGATAISAFVDNDSTYIPTSLINGGFDSEPWMKYINEDGATVLSVNKLEVSNKKIKEKDGVKEITPNGINEGWNSTEEVTSSDCELPVFFKWTNDYENSGLDSSNGYFIEQNAGNTEEAACQYQYITTNPGDVIRWGFKGTISENNAKHVSIEIGGFDFASSQVGEGAGIQTNSNLEKQSYYFEIDEVNTWKENQGVYVVPEGQNATRFAVIPNEEPAGEDNGSGVYLDDFYFDTLLGNLKAVRTEDGNIVLSGYWGESDTNKNLIVNTTTENQLTIVMSEVCNSNFKLTIPSEYTNETGCLSVYHEEYSANACIVPVEISHDHSYEYAVSDNRIIAFCTNDINKSVCDIQRENGDYIQLSLAADSECTYNGETKSASLSFIKYSNGVMLADVVSSVNVQELFKYDDKVISDEDIKYYQKIDGAYQSISAAPIAAGEYKAEISVCKDIEVTINKEFVIKPMPITIEANAQELDWGKEVSSEVTDIKVSTGYSLAEGDEITSVKLSSGGEEIATTDINIDEVVIKNGEKDVTKNYSITKNSGTLTRKKTAINPTVKIEGWEYGDEPNEPKITGNVGNVTPEITYYIDQVCNTKTNSDNAGAKSEGGVPAKVGTYYLKVVLPASSEGKTTKGDCSAKFTISKKAITEDLINGLKLDGVAVTDKNNISVKYDGNKHSLTIDSIKIGDVALVKDADYEVIGMKEYENPGSYNITIKAKDDSNYTGEISYSWDIEGVEIKTLSGYEVKNYSGCPTEKAKEYGVTLGGDSLGATVKYGTEAGKCNSTETPSFKSGKHTVYFEISKDGYETAHGSYEIVLEHKFDTEYTIDKEPNCEEDGLKSRHCLVDGCNKVTDEKIIKAIGHDYVKVILQNATCTEEGMARYTCSHDDNHFYTEIIPALGHDFPEEWTITKNPTDKEAGRREKSCKACDEKKVEEIPALNTVEENPLASMVDKEIQISKSSPISEVSLVTSKSDLLSDEKIFTSEDLEEMAKGKKISIALEIGEVSANAIQKAEEAIGQSIESAIETQIVKNKPTKVKCTLFDINLKKIYGDNTKYITELNNNIYINICMQEYMKSYNDMMERYYGLMLMHEGKMEVITENDPVNADGEYFKVDTDKNVIEIGANKFSIYGIFYYDTPARLPIREGGSAVIRMNTKANYYTGSQIRPKVSVWYTQQQFDSLGNRVGKKKNIRLKENVDYIVTYEDNVEVGTAKAIIKGIGDYSLSVTKEFVIRKKNANNWKMGKLPNLLADGTDQSATVSENLVVYDGKKIVDPSEYTINIKGDTVNPGSFKVTVSANADGNYRGACKKNKTVRILKEYKYDIKYASVSVVSKNGFAYKGSQIRAKVKVTINGEIVPKMYYDLIYKDNIDAGTATVFAIGKGKGVGISKGAEFEIDPVDITKVKVKKLLPTYWREDLSEIRPVVKFNGEYLEKDVDYEMEIENLSDDDVKGKLVSGNKITVLVTITTCDNPNFTDETEDGLVKKIVITKRNINSKLVSSVIGGKTVSGNGIIDPTVTVKYNGVTLTEDVDYKVVKIKTTVNKKTKIKKVKATVKGIGLYKGTKKITWTIEQEK